MKKLAYITSIIILSLIILYISGFLGFIKFYIFILFYAFIFYIFYFIYKKLQKKNIINFKAYLIHFIKKISLSTIIIIFILGTFGYYQNYYSPATMTEYTISNGKKIVVFQEMSHIGTKKFYDRIKNNLINYKKQNFVYFYEGVKPGTDINMKDFNEAIGIKFDKNLYKNFSKLYGVTFQTSKMYLGLVNNLDFNVDVDIDWIMRKYKNLPKNDESKIINTKNPIDINTEIINELSKLNNKELKILIFINKAILNFLIKSENSQNIIQENFSNKKLFDIILDGRNEILSKEIIKSKYEKIYITYGKLHFNGVLELLKKSDKNWKIISQKEINSMN